MALNKEFERYNTKIGIPASVVLETIFSTDNKDVETLSRWALKHGFVDLIEKKDGKYYQLQDDYTKQSFYTYLSKEERKQYDYENYLIDESEKKDKVINDLLKRISDLEFEVEKQEQRVDKAIEYIEKTYLIDYEYEKRYKLKDQWYAIELLKILKGVDKE